MSCRRTLLPLIAASALAALAGCATAPKPFELDPAVHNLPPVKAGDEVVVTFTEALAVSVEPVR